ncbi:putative flavin-containing monooxygenase [Glonium stellatum]|uniref:Putative flavin-containing monooxygenase n=1 Tax=Glonium stellatum TaxID=574774 RepID=A0A8E2JS42_9PEZI|nr:putative flavin-containing monooxygenase [Glonium stellatum]
MSFFLGPVARYCGVGGVLHQITRRSPSVKVADLPGSLPLANISDTVDCVAVAQKCLAYLSKPESNHFAADAIWRDILAFTGNFRTFYGSDRITSVWRQHCKKGTTFTVHPETAQVARFGPSIAWVQAAFEFDVSSEPARSCAGIVSLVPGDEDTWKIWMLRTWVENLQGCANVDTLRPRVPFAERKEEVGDFECVVVGAGQGGLSTAGRLEALGINYILLESNAAIGDNWRNRFDSATLHTPRNMAQLPFERTFTSETYSQWLSKDELADGYNKWVNKYGINVLTSTTLKAARWDDQLRIWTLTLRCGAEEKTMKTQHLVLCLGAGSQIPSVPSIPNRSAYSGEMLHSVAYKSSQNWTGKNAIIVGTGNTAHDVLEDMLSANLASITMVQRSPTYVIAQDRIVPLLEQLYNDTIPIELADRIDKTAPICIGSALTKLGLAAATAHEPCRYDDLERAGFKLDRSADIMDLLYIRLGGHHLDKGVSREIAAGKVRMKSDAEPVEFTSSGLIFSDGETINADVIIFCTGFVGNMREMAADIIGGEAADRLEDFWGLDSEGELRGAYKPLSYPGLWFMGGDCSMARFYSRFVALQIKACLEGQPFKS